jgi:sigma-B regulation protein RsbU (phosphoserine phosphatase)
MSLREAERKTVQGERIVKIASSFLYVDAGTPVYELLSELKEPYQSAIAVVDADLKIQGLIVPKDLVEILGKPFGRDLLKRQKVEDIMTRATAWRYDEYIQEIAERIGGDMETDRDAHYLLVDEIGRFCGHITSQDIIHYALNDHRRELEIAVRIQSRLVPPSFAVRSAKTSITCSSVMAQGVGGDFYFVKEYASGEWFFCLCDISGKGISAAIITAVLACFMYDADLVLPLEDTVVRLNRIILETFKLEKYLTGFFARFSERTGELEYCDMGHSFFFVVEGATVQQIADSADNAPVGLVAGIKPIARTLRIEPGTVLILVSDGIIEQKNRNGEDFPISEMGKIIERTIHDGEDLVRSKIKILESFFGFKKDIPQHDDISMLLFHFIGS